MNQEYNKYSEMNDNVEEVNVKPPRDDRISQVMEKTIEEFRSGNFPEIAAKTIIQADPNRPSAKWSMNNKMIIQIMANTSDARGYKQWLAVGRHVKKGERAVYILGPNQKIITEKNKETGLEETKSVLVGYFGIPVFAYQQTEGNDLPAYTPKSIPPLMEVAQKLGIKVSFQETVTQGAYGFYSPKKDEIVMGTSDELDFFHELTHAIDRRLGFEKEYKNREIVAEFTAAVLAKMYKVERTKESFNYINQVLSKTSTGTTEDTFRAIQKIVHKSEKILNFIFSVQ